MSQSHRAEVREKIEKLKITVEFRREQGDVIQQETNLPGVVVDAIMGIIDEAEQNGQKIGFLAGAVYAGILDEDALIVLKAFDEWAALQKGGGK